MKHHFSNNSLFVIIIYVSVVSFFGKSSYSYGGEKRRIISEAMGRSEFINEEDDNSEHANAIDMSVDEVKIIPIFFPPKPQLFLAIPCFPCRALNPPTFKIRGSFLFCLF